MHENLGHRESEKTQVKDFPGILWTLEDVGDLLTHQIILPLLSYVDYTLLAFYQLLSGAAFTPLLGSKAALTDTTKVDSGEIHRKSQKASSTYGLTKSNADEILISLLRNIRIP